MATRAVPFPIGPFKGGLNNADDPSGIADDEAAILENFDVTESGVLVSRPSMTQVTPRMTGNPDLRSLGSYTVPSTGVTYLLYSTWDNTVAPNVMRVVAFDPVQLTYTTVLSNSTTRITTMVVYAGKAWFICDPVYTTGTGGSWDGTTWTAIAAIPKGYTACIYKERMFVGSGANSATPSRVTFSNPADFTKWTGTDFFDVANGDGKPIQKLYTFNGSIVIFKTRATYVFAYDSAPGKGQVQMVSATVGTNSNFGVAEAENVLYTINGTDVYAIESWNWTLLNAKVNLEYANVNTGGVTADRYSSLCILGNRLMVRYYDNYYIFGLNTGVWSKWITSASKAADVFIQYPVADPATGVYTYYAGNYLMANATTNPTYLTKFVDRYGLNLDVESTYRCRVDSKVYNMDAPYSFKHLLWWGADVLCATTLNGRLIPVAYGTPVRWNELVNVLWSDRRNYTWGHPLTKSLEIGDSSPMYNYTNVRTFTRFLKNIRFRQLQFRLYTNVDGSNSTGPFEIYSATAFVVKKQTVGKEVN